jgi:lactate permease
MGATQVPVDALHWGLTILPIVALLVFLVPLRWRAPEAGPMAMFTAAVIALIAFRTPWTTLAVAGGKGVWDAIFILYVMWPALLLYQITKQAGAYDALRQGIAKVQSQRVVYHSGFLLGLLILLARYRRLWCAYRCSRAAARCFGG